MMARELLLLYKMSNAGRARFDVFNCINYAYNILDIGNRLLLLTYWPQKKKKKRKPNLNSSRQKYST